MCGIFFSLSRGGYESPSASSETLLKNRGPDTAGNLQVLIAPQLHATFISTVLSLRGSSIVKQPLKDNDTQSVLCWNGEAWKIGDEVVRGNDSELVFDLMLRASAGLPADQPSSSIQRVTEAISSIRGPFAFVFFDAVHALLYYGRDCLGRRSLLRKSASSGDMVLSSVCDNDSGDQWSEIDADGLYVVDLKPTFNQFPNITHIPARRRDDVMNELHLVGKSIVVSPVY